MNTSRAAVASYFRVFLFGFAMVFSISCHRDATAPTDEGGQGHIQQFTRAHGPAFMSPGDTSRCATTSGVLQVNHDLTLYSRNSRVEYQDRAVESPTAVSFSVCYLDSTGTFLTPKAAVFGPIPNSQFLRTFKVKLDPVDAGLRGDIHDGTYYRLYRRNEVSGGWDSVLTERISHHKVEYRIDRNGTYAITLANLAIDTTWRSTAIVPPGGGTITLLNSSIEFPKTALGQPTLVTFALTTGVENVGLPGATDRGFDFGPEGTVFLVPVTLYVSFEDAGYNGSDMKATTLRFYYFNTTTSSWVQQPTVIDWQNEQFVVTLSHFSRYAFGR